MLYRARAFEFDDKLARTAGHSPRPAARTVDCGGRMNARGISVFNGASNQKTAIAEWRPPLKRKLR
jgi:hypothetical protein